MKFYTVFLILILCTTKIICAQTETPNLDTLIQYLEVESLDKSFASITNAGEFIRKFELTEEEIQLIGFWLTNDFIETNKQARNKGVYSVTFLPNRILMLGIPLNIVQDDTVSAFCMWRVSNGAIEINPIYLLETKREKGVVILQNSISINDSHYFSIGEVEKYEKAYVQRFPWNWEKLNKYISNENIICGVDYLRYRRVFEYAMPDIFQRIGIREDTRNLLYNPEYGNPDYLFNLYLEEW